MSIAIIIGLIIATAVPLVVLYMIRKLDLYGTGDFKMVVFGALWGAMAFGISFGLNLLFNMEAVDTFLRSISGPTFITKPVDGLLFVYQDWDTFRRFTAPFVEEVVKGSILLYLVRRKDFTYFVDGAIYGFAIGIGFAVVENYFYLFEYGGQIGIAVSRVLSTNLVHATGSALIGIAVGFARFHKGLQRYLLPLGGLALAIGFHTLFNNMVTRDEVSLLGLTVNLQQFILLYAIIVGFSGTGLIVVAIRSGINEGKEWVEEKIGEIERVTSGEAELAKRVPTLRELLMPVAEQFGEEKAEQSEALITLQARLGIYRKTMERLPDEKMKANLERQIEETTAKMEEMRKEIGAYCMLYIRGIIPEDISPLWNLLDNKIEQAHQQQKSDGPSLWTRLGKKTDE